jgi:phytoene dehydrogenase-like protein
MTTLAQALADAAKAFGAEIRTAADVARIEGAKVILQNGEGS